MSLNDRIFYATQAVGIHGHGDGGNVLPAEMVHGLQSVGINTTFNLEQAFELGQIEIYEKVFNSIISGTFNQSCIIKNYYFILKTVIS